MWYIFLIKMLNSPVWWSSMIVKFINLFFLKNSKFSAQFLQKIFHVVYFLIVYGLNRLIVLNYPLNFSFSDKYYSYDSGKVSDSHEFDFWIIWISVNP